MVQVGARLIGHMAHWGASDLASVISHLPSHPPFPMPRGKALSDDLRGVILNMSMYLSVNQIRDYTGITKWTIYRILQDFQRRGSVARAHLMQSLQGRKRSLTTTDVRV